MALVCTWEAPPSLYPVTFALLGVVSLQPRSHLEENLRQGRAARRGQEGNSVKGPVRCEDGQPRARPLPSCPPSEAPQ